MVHTVGVHFHIGKRPEVPEVPTCNVECSHFAREGSMLYTENQSDEN